MRKIQTKLAVIGGGPAGVCAAITAARLGMQTVLVTNRPMLGGNSSSEIRVWTRGAGGAGNLWAEEMGIWGEMKLENLYRNPEGNPVFWDETLMDAVLKQERLELYLNTEIFAVSTHKDGRVAGVFGVQQGSEEQLEIAAEWFIDATGDGSIGVKANVPFEMGNERHETLGNSILYYTRKEAEAVRFIAPDYAYDMAHIEKILGYGGRIVNEKMSGSDCWWFEYGGALDTIRDAQDIAIELRRLVLGVWNYVKNSGKFDADNYTLEWVGTIPGKRESRRMRTDYVLTEQDILTQRVFADGVCYGGWYVDMHPAGGMYDSGEENCVQTPVKVYQIPLRCLHNRAVANLLFAGRNIGVERSAFFSSRVMNTCAGVGQAAATAVALCERVGKSPAELSTEEISAVRRTLARDDMFVPGAVIVDAEDLAKKAWVRASSAHNGLPGAATGRLRMEKGGFVAFPAQRGKTVKLEVYAAKPTVLQIECAVAKLPNRLNLGQQAVLRSWTLQEGMQTIEAEITEEDVFCIWKIAPAPGVEVLLCARERVGFLCGEDGNPAYFEPRMWYENAPALYQAEQVIAGESRPWGQPNVWIAAAEDKRPWLRLGWERAIPVREIRLYLDPDLTLELPSSRARQWENSHQLAARERMPEQLVRTLTISGRGENGQWVALLKREEQHQRLVRVTLPEALPLTELRLDVHATWGAGAAAVYRVSVF